jgi:hypothetical protein
MIADEEAAARVANLSLVSSAIYLGVSSDVAIMQHGVKLIPTRFSSFGH